MHPFDISGIAKYMLDPEHAWLRSKCRYLGIVISARTHGQRRGEQQGRHDIGG